MATTNIHDAPLSDLILAHRRAPIDQTIYGRLLSTFVDAQLGVVASGIPEGFEGSLVAEAGQSLGISITKDLQGNKVVLAFADPLAFVERFGEQFNAVISGREILGVVVHNADCHGVRVNSALEEVSWIIDRATTYRMLGMEPAPAQKDARPWWRFW